MNVPCLPNTGAGTTDSWPLLMSGLLVLIGFALIAVAASRGRSERGAAGVRAAMVVVLAAPAVVGLLMVLASSANATDECSVGGQPSASAPAQPADSTSPIKPGVKGTHAAPTTPVATTQTPTETTTPVEVTCPTNGDIATLPAGQSIKWSPVLVSDPRDQPGTTDGEVVMVWSYGISGYTWSIVDESGASSGTCGGYPNSGGACVGYPQTLPFATYFWDAAGEEWLPTGGSGGTSGCGGGGGNN